MIVRTRCKACTNAKKQRFGDRYGSAGSGGRSEAQATSACYLCGQLGHLSSSCPSAPKQAGACFYCGQTGHKARECKSASAGSCFRCGKPGHLSRNCKEPPKAWA